MFASLSLNRPLLNPLPASDAALVVVVVAVVDYNSTAAIIRQILVVDLNQEVACKILLLVNLIQGVHYKAAAIVDYD